MSLKARAVLLCVMAFTAVITFGGITLLSFQDLHQLQLEREQSYTIVDGAINQQNQKNSVQKDKLTEEANSLQPVFRKTALLDMLQNPSNSNLQHLLKTEDNFRKHVGSQISYLEKRLSYYGAITVVVSLIVCLALLAFTLKLVFAPLNDLSTKMTDFLNQKYSYQFTVPEDHEIGHLHATFNAMAQKVLRQIEELKSLDKAKSEFLSIASHELRTPLTSIRGSLGLLEGGIVGPMNEAAKNLMHIALNETERLIRIINELLDLAKIEARQFPLQKKWIDAKIFSTKTLTSLKGFADAADVRLEIGEFENVELNIDSDRMQQVLTNLLSNAIKFSPKKAAVKLNLKKSTQAMLFEITDSGKGIAPEDQELIFEKFRQVTGPNNPLVKGTGLGLAIAKALVEQHGGQIGVKSRPGEGSTFYFSVPEFRVLQKSDTTAEAS